MTFSCTDMDLFVFWCNRGAGWWENLATVEVCESGAAYGDSRADWVSAALPYSSAMWHVWVLR